MSTTSPQPSLPSQPLGRTFLTAISILGLFAVVQVLAVIWHYIPTVRQQIQSTAVPEQPAQTLPYRPQPASSVSAAPLPAAQSISSADIAKVQSLIVEAKRKVRVEGEYDEALKLLQQAESLLPGDPKILFEKAKILERLDQPGEAIAALTEVAQYPGLPSQDKAEVERKLAQLSRMIGESGASGATTSLVEAEPEQALRENGVPLGATLGIVDVKLRDSSGGDKSLRVAVKSLPGSTINAKDVKMLVYFYEETEEGVQLTESPVGSQWQSQPIDWASDLPELVEMTYKAPPADANAPARKYFGYVIGIYYQGVLQDFRSDPSKLARDFPLPLDMKQAPPAGPQ